jgi:hypothetical protein
MPSFPDLVHRANPVLNKLSSGGTKAGGGDNIRQDVLYQATQDGPYFDYDQGETSAEDQATAAQYAWKLYRQRVVISVPEINRNSGPEAIFKLLKGKMKMASEAIRSNLADDLYDETGSDSGKAINGIPNIIGNGTYPAAAISGTVVSGGINKTNNAFFRGVATDMAGTSAGLIAKLEALWYNLIDGSIVPDMIVSDPAAQLAHRSEVTAGGTSMAVRHVNTMELERGFNVITFQGQPWFVDRHVPTDITDLKASLFMLNSDTIDLVAHKNENFRWSGFKEPTDQNVRIGWIYWMGNTVCSQPWRNGMLYEVT